MRSIIALDPLLFGRGPRYLLEGDERSNRPAAWVTDLKIFVTTFCGGFLFAAIYLV